jgi:hypothetical protein
MTQAKHPSRFNTEQVKFHLADSSQALAHLTANMVYDEPSFFKPLLDVALADTNPHAQRAARIVYICSSRFPELFQPYCSQVIRQIKNKRTEGVIRNFLKIIAEVPVKLTNRDKSILINLCFDYLVSKEYPAAIRVFSMQVLFNLSREIPEIGEELFRILEEQLPEASAGYRSRAKRILKKGGRRM